MIEREREVMAGCPRPRKYRGTPKYRLVSGQSEGWQQVPRTTLALVLDRGRRPAACELPLPAGWDGMGLTVLAAAEADVEVVERRAESECGQGLSGVDGDCPPWRARARLFARRDVERWQGLL